MGVNRDDDWTLIRRCRSGAVRAFQPLVRRYEGRALAYAGVLLGDDAEAEDAVQEAFIRAHRSLDRLEQGSPFWPWLRTILRNLCLDRLGSAAWRRERPWPDDDAPAPSLPAGELRAVTAHLEGCSECRRELALIRTVRRTMRNAEMKRETSVWEGVRRRIAGPAGWLLVVAGTVILAALSAVEWFRDGDLTLEWLATTGLAVGFGLLLVSIGWEQYREWKTSPYKDLER